MRARTTPGVSGVSASEITPQDRQPWRQWSDCLLSGLILAGLFVYIWKVVQPHLLYYGFGVFGPFPMFSWDAMFLHQNLGTPGSPVRILTGFLSRWYYQSWLGAGIAVASVGALVLGTRRLLRSAGAGWGRDLAWVPALLAMVMINRYDHPLQAVLALGISTWIAVVYLTIARLRSNLALQAVVFAALVSLCFYLTAGSALVFGLVACLAMGLIERQVVRAAMLAALTISVTLVLGYGLFGLDPRDAFTLGTPLSAEVISPLTGFSQWMLRGLYLAVPLAIVWVAVWRWLVQGLRRMRPPKRPVSGPARPAQPGPQRPWMWTVARGLGLSCVFALALMFSRGVERYQLATHYLSRQRDWTGVLRVAAEMKARRYACTPSCLFDIDRALAELGRMGDDLCAYPQDVNVLAFLSIPDTGHQILFAKLLDLHFDLGDLNAAEQDAYELLEMQGPCPFILEALARVHIAKGEYAAAEVPLKILRKDPAFGATASHWLALMADPAKLDADPDVVSWRRWKRSNDRNREEYVHQILIGLLQDHPDNRLAFEYLMGFYLLTYQRAKIADNLVRFRDLGYERLPKHVAEALMIESSQTRKSINLQGWTLDQGIVDQFKQISEALRGLRGNKQAPAILGPRYGDTYAFYSAFNISGVK